MVVVVVVEGHVLPHTILRTSVALFPCFRDRFERDRQAKAWARMGGWEGGREMGLGGFGMGSASHGEGVDGW